MVAVAIAVALALALPLALASSTGSSTGRQYHTAANFGQSLGVRVESLTGEEGPVHSGNNVAVQK